MSDLEVKKALPQEAAWIVQAQVLMANETENLPLNPDKVVTGVSYIFDHPDRGFYLVAKNETANLVGCLLILKEWSDWRNGDVWWIHSVYVLPDYRKHGVFRMMFDHAEALARKSQVRGLRLYVDKTNVNAQRVYEKLGMNNDHYELFEKMF